MARQAVMGSCHICGGEGELTGEHVPPKKAFNNKRYIRMKFEDAVALGPEELPKGKYEQGGVKMYTLCGWCNNNTGTWYAKDFVDWCYQAVAILDATGGKPSLIYMYHAFPLRIIKQIITMFFSVNGNGFATKHPALVDFVLGKTRKYLPPNYRFFVYYNLGGKLRYSGVSGRSNIATGEVIAFSEMTFPPLGYVMTFGTKPPDKRLYEITHFSRYGYDEYEYIKLHPPVLPTHLALPGDYRTREEIQQDALASKSVMPEDTILGVYDTTQHCEDLS